MKKTSPVLKIFFTFLLLISFAIGLHFSQSFCFAETKLPDAVKAKLPSDKLPPAPGGAAVIPASDQVQPPPVDMPTPPGFGPPQLPTFEETDANKDGFVTEDEMNTFRAHRMAQRAKEGRPMRNAGMAPDFKMMDANKDGKLSKEEYDNFHSKFHRGMNRMMRQKLGPGGGAGAGPGAGVAGPGVPLSGGGQAPAAEKK